MAKNANLHKAKVAKNDEFYTQRVDIENELSHYAEHFKDKVVYCNCDDPETSEFWQFFKRNFKPWGLKRLIATHYEPDAKNYAYVLEISQDTNGDGVVDWKDDPTITPLPCNGDFRSAACIELLKQADIIVTNPPFSLFREYVAQLIEYDKKFLIIGNPNAITYKEIFPLIKNNSVWIGHKSMGTDMLFKTTKEYESELRQNKKEGSGYKIINGEFYARAAAIWYTNLDIPKRHIHLDLRGNHYYGNEEKYPKYDNYDAIECSKVSDIPEDYEPCWYKCEHAAECEYAQKEGHPEAIALCEKACNGEIGVPITYLDRHNEAQIEIVGADYEMANPEPLENGKSGTGRFYIKDVDSTMQNGGQSLAEPSRAEPSRAEPSDSSIQPNRYQAQEGVTESSESQSQCSTNTALNNSKSYGKLQETRTQMLQSRFSNSSTLIQKSNTAVALARPLAAERLCTAESSSARKCNGILGVPITYLDLHCENQFEIIGISSKDNCGNVPRLKENSYYSGYTRGKVITRVESNMPLIANPSAGGTKCSKHDFPDIYQLYWRVFIRKNKE